MIRSNRAVSIVSIFVGSLLGAVAGIIGAIAMTIWTFQGVGAAQGFADDPDWVPSTLAAFCVLGILGGGPIGGYLGHRAADPGRDEEGPKVVDDLA